MNKAQGKDKERKSDVMVMEKKSKVSVTGLEAEIIETTKYKPPTTQITARSNIVSPNTGSKKGKAIEEELKKDQESDVNELYRKKRRIENQLEKQAFMNDKK